jgi:hypothetical protein
MVRIHFPPAASQANSGESLASITRCASRISSKLNILVGLTSSRPAAASAAIAASSAHGRSDSIRPAIGGSPAVASRRDMR